MRGRWARLGRPAGHLLQEGLIDELHLLVHPVAVGAGKRLFEPGEKVQLRLIDSTTFSTGVPRLVYGPAS